MRDGPTPEEMQERAANGYIVWPLSVVDLLREPPNATAWSRLHTRQAFVYGLVAGVSYVVLLALPLLLVIVLPAVSTTVVVWLYGLGLLADVAGALALLVVSLRYRGRARRGELFGIPLVTPVADQLFPREH